MATNLRCRNKSHEKERYAGSRCQGWHQLVTSGTHHGWRAVEEIYGHNGEGGTCLQERALRLETGTKGRASVAGRETTGGRE